MPADRPATASETQTACEPLERLAAEYVTRLRAGERPALSDYQGRHPELASGIAELFPTIAALEGLRADESGLPGGQPANLGEFRILRELGRGGMGVVYLAEQPSLARKVALKVLPAAATPDSTSRLRFQREARLAAGLSHPCITPVYAVGEGEGTPWFAMQLLQGVGLDQLIDVLAAGATVTPASGGFPGLVRRMRDGVPVLRARADWQGQAWLQRAIARLIAQVAEALHYAHQQGVLHRDVKPANLILDIEGRIWVNDFGLAKTVGEADMTSQNSITGTLLYLAPERFDGVADRRCDIYSLGLVLYELLAKKRAFPQESRTQLFKAIIMDGVPPLRFHAPGIPGELAQIVDRACARKPERRYGDAASMARDLLQFADSPALPSGAQPPAPVRPPSVPAGAATGSPHLALLLGCVLLGMALLLWRTAPSAPAPAVSRAPPAALPAPAAAAPQRAPAALPPATAPAVEGAAEATAQRQATSPAGAGAAAPEPANALLPPAAIPPVVPPPVAPSTDPPASGRTARMPVPDPAAPAIAPPPPRDVVYLVPPPDDPPHPPVPPDGPGGPPRGGPPGPPPGGPGGDGPGVPPRGGPPGPAPRGPGGPPRRP